MRFLRKSGRGDRLLRDERSPQAVQIGANFGSELIAKLAIFFERLQDDFFQPQRNIGIEMRGRFRDAMQNRVGNGFRSFPSKGHNARGHLIQDHAEGKQVGARI